jgi:transcriptional regulator with XRE-family HTH domain
MLEGVLADIEVAAEGVKALLYGPRGVQMWVVLNVLRRRLGLNQSELAARLGVTQSVVSKWNTGGQRPGRESAERLRPLLESAMLVPGPAGGTAILARFLDELNS